MERILSAIEWTAGLALALVAGLIFMTAVLRYVFSVNLPDGFDFARYLQGIAILWGLSVTTYRSGHISVDLIWEIGGPGVKRAIDIFAGLVTAAFFCAFAWVLMTRLPSFMASREVTADMHLVIWPFYLAAALGVVATALVALVVLIRACQPRKATHHHG